MAVADADSPAIRVYLSDGTSDAVGQFDGHSSPVLTLAFNEPAMTVVSADRCDDFLVSVLVFVFFVDVTAPGCCR